MGGRTDRDRRRTAGVSRTARAALRQATGGRPRRRNRGQSGSDRRFLVRAKSEQGEDFRPRRLAKYRRRSRGPHLRSEIDLHSATRSGSAYRRRPAASRHSGAGDRLRTAARSHARRGCRSRSDGAGGARMTNVPLGVPSLIVLVGPPGSGKSTWAKQNGRGAVHVSQDDLIDAISPDGFDHIYRTVYRAAEDAIAREALEQGHTVIVDRTNRTRAHRHRWLQIAREADCPAVAIAMRASLLLCCERNRQRQDPRRLSED